MSGLSIQPHEKLQMLRLMGRQPLEAVRSAEVARVFLACHALEPHYDYAFQELRCEIYGHRFKSHKKRLKRWDNYGITPADATAAREVLLGIMDDAIERLRAREADLQELAGKAQPLEQKMMGNDGSKASAQLQRQLVSCNRLIIANVNAVSKRRRDEANGWGRTRAERERKKCGGDGIQDGGRRAEGGGKNGREQERGGGVDERLVMDERGTVRNAHGYKGNLEDGLARFEKEVASGEQARAARSRRELDALNAFSSGAIPDYARWVTRAEDGGEDVGAGMGSGVGVESGLEREGDGLEVGGAVSLGVVGEGERADFQNEISGDDGVQVVGWV